MPVLTDKFVCIVRLHAVCLPSHLVSTVFRAIRISNVEISGPLLTVPGYPPSQMSIYPDLRGCATLELHSMHSTSISNGLKQIKTMQDVCLHLGLLHSSHCLSANSQGLSNATALLLDAQHANRCGFSLQLWSLSSASQQVLSGSASLIAHLMRTA